MIITINIDDPNAIAAHTWAHTPDNAERTSYTGVEGQAATVTVGSLEFAVGYDPNEDGILWAINYLDSNGTREMLHNGGWTPGDEDTAQREIDHIITVMNENTD